MKRMNGKIWIVLPLLWGILFTVCSGEKEKINWDSRIKEASWPVFRGDAALSGVSDQSLPEEPVLWWKFNTGAFIASSPVIGFGAVYLGSTNGKVYSLNLKDGKKLWEFDSGDEIQASGLLLNNSLYIGNLSGDFFRLNAGDGKLIWKHRLPNSVYGGANYLRTNSGKGELLIFVGCYDNLMYCFNAETGKIKWSYETSHYINGSPACNGTSLIFGGCDENLHILSPLKGSKIGEVNAGSYIPGSAALVGNRAYLGHYGRKLACIDTVNKKIIWEYQAGKDGDAFFSSPAVDQNHVVIGSRDGRLHCVDRESGKYLWSFKTRDEVDSSPVIAKDQVVFGSIDGRLYLLDLASGEKIWSYEIGSEIIGSPAVTSGIMVVGAEDGRIYTFGGKK